MLLFVESWIENFPLTISQIGLTPVNKLIEKPGNAGLQVVQSKVSCLRYCWVEIIKPRNLRGFLNLWSLPENCRTNYWPFEIEQLYDFYKDAITTKTHNYSLRKLASCMQEYKLFIINF